VERTTRPYVKYNVLGERGKPKEGVRVGASRFVKRWWVGVSAPPPIDLLSHEKGVHNSIASRQVRGDSRHLSQDDVSLPFLQLRPFQASTPVGCNHAQTQANFIHGGKQNRLKVAAGLKPIPCV
jgi:hypothetical protein